MLRSLCRYLSQTSWNQGVSKNIYNSWLFCVFFSCLHQLLQEKSSFITSRKWNLLPFPLIHIVILALHAPRPSSAVLVLCPITILLSHFFGHACQPTGKALLRLGCVLVESPGFLAFLSSVILLLICCFHFYLYPLQFSVQHYFKPKLLCLFMQGRDGVMTLFIVEALSLSGFLTL